MSVDYLYYISFNQPWFLLLLFQPVLMMFLVKTKEFRLSLYADKHLWPWVIKMPNKSEYVWQKILFIIAWSLFVIALSGPRIPVIDEVSGTQITMRQDVTIMLIINLHTTKTNYDKTTIVNINDFIKTLKGERVGIIAVSSAYGLVSPLTRDYEALKFYTKYSFSVVDTKNINLTHKMNTAFNTASKMLAKSNATSSAIIYISEKGNVNLKASEIKKLQKTFNRIQKNNISILPITMFSDSKNSSYAINSIILNSGRQQFENISDLTPTNIYDQVIESLPASINLNPVFKSKTELFPYFLLLGFILYSISSIPLRNLF